MNYQQPGYVPQQTPGQVPQRAPQQRAPRMSTGMGGEQNTYNAGFTKILDFFVPGVVSNIPSQKRMLRGRILPVHKLGLSQNDPSWATSFDAYRYPENDPANVDQSRGCPRLTPWASRFVGYRMFGRMSLDISSPKNLEIWQKSMDARLIKDPISDIRFMVKKLGPAYKHWLESKSDTEGAPIPKYKTMFMLNFFGSSHDQDPLANCVTTTAEAALTYMASQLAINTPYGTQPRDLNFPRYMYGDVTHPQTGLWCYSSLVQSGTIHTTALVFNEVPNSLQGTAPYPVGEDVLRNRVPLDFSILNVQTYQKIVEYLVEDGTIPWEWINAACSWNANVPPAPPQHQVTSQPGMQPGGMPQQGWQQPGGVPPGMPQQQPPMGPPMGPPQQGWQQPPGMPPQQPAGAAPLWQPGPPPMQGGMPPGMPQQGGMTPPGMPQQPPIGVAGMPPGMSQQPAGMPPGLPQQPAGAADDDDDDTDYVPGLQPQQQVPPQQAPPQQAPPQVSFWLTFDENGGRVEAAPHDGAAVQQLLNAGRSFRVMALNDAKQRWLSPLQCGFHKPQPPQAPPMQAPPPQAPPMQAPPPAPPVAQQAPAGIGAAPNAPMGMQQLPPLNDVELARFNELRQKVHAKAEITLAESGEFKSLRERANANSQVG